VDKLRLSICIATFNRAPFLQETLESICSQISDKVEVVIVDGGSTDESPRVVNSFENRLENLVYHRLDEKGGVDQDYAKAVSLARGDYCWLFTDDDLLKPGAIDGILDAIDDDYPLIIVNAEIWDADFINKLVENRLGLKANKTYGKDDFEQLFIEVAEYLSFIGCVVIKRELWHAREKEPYFGSLFIHVGVIFQERIPGDTLILSQPLIKIRYGNALWTDRSFEIWIFKWPELLWSFRSISDRAKMKVRKKEPRQRLKTLLLFRAQGTYGKDEYWRWIRPLPYSKGQQLILGLIANLPGHLLNLLASIYYRRRSHWSGVQLYDIRKSRYHYRNLF
jgi:abequosyltransferase